MNVAKIGLNQRPKMIADKDLNNSNKTNVSFGLGCSNRAKEIIDKIELNAQKGLEANPSDTTCKGILEDIKNIKKYFGQHSSSDIYLRVINIPTDGASKVQKKTPVFALSVRLWPYARFFPGNLEDLSLRHKDLVQALTNMKTLRGFILRQEHIIEPWATKPNK